MNTKNIRMIVLDLDGTLLRTDKTVSQRTLEALQRCQRQNILVVIATARFWIGAEKYIDLLHPDYEITTDGTMIHHAGQMVYGHGFDLETTNALIQRIRAKNVDAEITAAVGRKVYWNSLHIAESDRLYKAEYNDYACPLSESAYKIVADLPERADAELIAKACGCRLIGYRDESIYSFIPAEAGKVQAIASLAGKLDIAREEIAAFGDDENDVGMLEFCGKGIAVANALPAVKAVADEICGSNDEDGVAGWLEENVLHRF